MYSLDTKMAREGSGSLGGSISETGKYLGAIEWAREVVNNNGTKLIEIRFMSSENQGATIKVYVQNNQGEALAGMKKIHALMTCLKIRSMTPVTGQVNAWDYDSGAVTAQQSQILPELANKPVGLILQKEFYFNANGEEKHQINLFAPFTIDTHQTAAEVLDGRNECEAVDRITESVKDSRRNQNGPNQVPQQVQQQGIAQSTQMAPMDDLDDAIPF